jgi:Leucine-rich repeat (LRR) protein
LYFSSKATNLPLNHLQAVVTNGGLDLSNVNGNINCLEPDLFVNIGSPTITKFSFLNNLVQTHLPEYFFKGVTSLKTIDFYANLIKKVPSKFFNGLVLLESIGFSINQIETFDDPLVLQGLVNLKSLDLSVNKLSSMKPSVLSGLPSLVFLTLEDNPLTPDILANRPAFGATLVSGCSPCGLTVYFGI